MEYRFTINGRLPGINDLIAADRRDRRAGNRRKQEAQEVVRIYILRDLKKLRIEEPVELHYRFFEPNRKRDMDNISGFAHKVIQDALVLSGVLKNDGWSNIVGMEDRFFVDSTRPRIEVTISEVDRSGHSEAGQRDPASGRF